MSALVIVAVVFVVFGVCGLIAAAIERLPTFPPMYDDSDILPDPEWRARVAQPDPYREWITEEQT